MIAGARKQRAVQKLRRLAKADLLVKSARHSEELDRRIDEALDASYHDGSGAWDSTAVRWWIKYHIARGEDPFAVHGPESSLLEKLDDEKRLMRFMIWLCDEKPEPTSVDTARGYTSTVQGWLARNFGVKLGAGMELHRIAQVVKGLHRLKGGRPRRKLRKAFTPEKLSRALSFLDSQLPLHANVRAALAVMLQGLLRGGEACQGDRRKTWRPERELTRDDVAFFTGGAQLIIVAEKDNNTLGAKNTPVLIGSGGLLVDAVAELRNLFKIDPVAPSMMGKTPCFRDPRSGAALTVQDLNAWVKRLTELIGEDPNEYGSHSLRIGGATALYKAGCSPLDIKVAGRWDSDCYLIYIHADRERALRMSSCLASTRCELAEDPFLEIGLDKSELELA